MRGIALFIIAALTATGARAERIAVGPDACPAPADAPPYAGEDVEAEDLNPWREAAGDMAPFIDLNVAEHPQADRIFLRLWADPETGEALAPPASACAD